MRIAWIAGMRVAYIQNHITKDHRTRAIAGCSMALCILGLPGTEAGIVNDSNGNCLGARRARDDRTGVLREPAAVRRRRAGDLGARGGLLPDRARRAVLRLV